MLIHPNETELKKTKTIENFNQKLLLKKSYLEKDMKDKEKKNDFTRFVDKIDINLFGFQAKLLYRKLTSQKFNHSTNIKKNLFGSKEKTSNKNDVKPGYVCDGGLTKKINKYKKNITNNKSHSPNHKVKKNNYVSKTNRDNNRKIKLTKSQEHKIIKVNYIPQTTKSLNYNRGFFSNDRIYSNKSSKSKDKLNGKTKIFDPKINVKYISDKNTIVSDNKKRKDYVNNLIKNVVSCLEKEYNSKMNNFSKMDKSTERKIDFLKENGFEHFGKQEENGLVINQNIPLKIKKINTNNISNLNNSGHFNLKIYTDNDKFYHNNITNIIKNETSENNNKIKNNITTHISKENISIIKNKSKIHLKPKINQFEFLEKIKEIKNQEKLKKSEKIEKIEKIVKKTKKKISPKKKNIENNTCKYIQIKKQKNDNKENESKTQITDDGFLYADKITHRTQNELNKFVKKKKRERKMEQKEEINIKNTKIYNTLENLMKLGEECKNNFNNTNKLRNDSKNHLKGRKINNEYYFGFDSSKSNTSTFIDKQEYYKSILDSKNFLKYSQIEKTEVNLDENKLTMRNLIICNSKSDKDKSKNPNSFLFNNGRHEDDGNKNICINFDEEEKYKLNNLRKIVPDKKGTYDLFKKINIKLKNKNNDNDNPIKSKKIYLDNYINEKDKEKSNTRSKEGKKSKVLFSNYSIKTFIKLLKKYITRKIWKDIRKCYSLSTLKEKINILIFTFKRLSFHKIKLYCSKVKFYSFSKKLSLVFKIHYFSLLKQNCLYIGKYHDLIKAIDIYIKKKIMKNMLRYCVKMQFLKTILVPGIQILEKLFLLKYFQKLKLINNDNNNQIFIPCIKSFLSKYCENEDKKSNSYMYESLDCEDSISVHPNSVENDGLHQLKEIIEMQNENKFDENSLSDESGLLYNNELYNPRKTSNKNSNPNKIQIKEHLLRQIINNNETSADNLIQNHDDFEDKNINLIATQIAEDKIGLNKDDELENTSKKSNNDLINIIENVTLEENDDSKNKKLMKICPNIKDKDKFADELTDYIIAKILIDKEIKEEELLPEKSEISLNKYQDFNMQMLMNNPNNSNLESLLTLSDYSQSNSQLIEKSMILQCSITSEFNKSIREKKNKLESNIYNNYIIEQLIRTICKEIKNNYSRIFDNIIIPYKVDYRQLIISSFWQFNKQLNRPFKILPVKEELKKIFDKEQILKKFNSLSSNIRRIKGIEENNDYDNLINECIIDATIEIINKERPYGIYGEPFPFSKRERELEFKYTKNNPKPLIKKVYKSLKKMIFGKGNIIKENSPIFDKNDPFLLNIFKKEMENENIWNELELQEEQIKCFASTFIFEQLINEVIEILEHVQLNRKKPDLYQNKSIYSCDEIPRLPFQIITNTEVDDSEADLVLC